MAMIDLHVLPPGFGFHPTDEELVVHYLKGKVHGRNQEQFEIIPVIELYKYEPWDLPGKCLVPTRDSKWHFFSPRDKKYPNGVRKNRATEKGYWKATGKDRNIRSVKRVVGTKKTLVFHEGRAPNGKRTDWVMHEYHLDEKECTALAAGMHESYVLCRICKKNGFDLQENAAEETEITGPSPKEAETHRLCIPKLEEGSPGTVREIAPVAAPPLRGMPEECSKGSPSTGPATSVVQTHDTLSEIWPSQYWGEWPAETEEDVEMWKTFFDNQPYPWGETLEGCLDSIPGPMAAMVPLQSSGIVLGDDLQSPKPEGLIAAANQEFLVGYEYQEAESSIRGEHGRPAQVPAGNSETDVNVEALIAELCKAEDFVVAADQEFPVGFEYQEAESSFHSEFVRPDAVPAENSEIDVNEADLLAELYMATTGKPLHLDSYPASHGVSLSDLGIHEEPATNETGIQIRRRHHELPEEFISQGPRIRLQVHKMESAATGAVKTCTFEDQTVAVREHDDSSYKPGGQSLRLENSNKKSSIQTGELRVLKNSSSPSELSQSGRRSKPAKATTSEILHSEANPCTASSTAKSISSTPGSSKTGGSSFFSGSIRTWLSPSPSRNKVVTETAAVDCEQANTGGCSLMFHLRRYVSTGLCWVLPAFCVVGTSLPLLLVLLRNMFVCVKGTSNVNL